MKKVNWKRRAGRLVLGIIIFFIVACFLFDHFVQFRMSDNELNELFSENNIPGKIHYDTIQGRQIRYIGIGSDTLPSIFFLHGSPSSLSIYKHFFTDTFFIRNFRMVAVDRPGYGNSGFGIPEPSIRKQSDMLWPILSSMRRKGKPLLVVAGSYGTSVGCRMLMDHPGSADGMLLIAPSLAPGEEKTYWFARIIENPLINWFIPRMFQSANTEKLHHAAGLKEMLPHWSRINVPVFYLQGANDQLIYTSNAAFAKKHLINVPRLQIEFLKDRPHFFAFSDRMVIRQKILDLYKMVTSPALKGY